VILIGKYMAFRSFRVYSKLEIDNMMGDTDVEAVLLFKNPLLQPSLLLSVLQRIVLKALVFRL
jgi:hypothetical protein